MDERQEQITEFMDELYDKFYPQVISGVDLLSRGRTAEGIEILARPLHTIKGVTGFLGGFDEAARFTHEVESYLKKLQSGEVANTPENVNPAINAVTMVFQVIEQIREKGEADRAEADRTLNQLKKLSLRKSISDDRSGFDLVAKVENGVLAMRFKTRRVHLKAHRDAIVSEMSKHSGPKPALLNLNDVYSFNSSSWEVVEAFSASFPVCVSNMNDFCLQIFYSWGFNRSISYFRSEEDFWKRTEENPVDRRIFR